MPEVESRPILCIFDFDQTVIDCNSDTWIHKLGPGEKVPIELRKDVEWTEYMRRTFEYLFKNGVTRGDYEKCLKQMPFVAGMKELFTTLANAKDINGLPKYEILICSDSNTFFISTFLEHHKFDTAIK